MKVTTTATVRVGGEKRIYLPPGEHELDDAVARELLAKGFALTPAAKAAIEAKAKTADKRP